MGGEAAVAADGRPPPPRATATAAPLQSVLASGSGVLGSLEIGLEISTHTADNAAGNAAGIAAGTPSGEAPTQLPAVARGRFYRMVATLHLDGRVAAPSHPNPDPNPSPHPHPHPHPHPNPG